MFPCLKILKSKAVLALATAFLVAAPVLANAQTTGTVSFTVTKYGFFVGTAAVRSAGLQRQGVSTAVGRHLCGTIGGSRTVLTGTASNLRAAADIAGSYTAVGAGAAFAGLEEGP